MLLIVPPTSVVTLAGTGRGSRIGSWPSVSSAPEVAELSRISVFGSGGGAGGICTISGTTIWGSAARVPDFFSSVGDGCAVVDGTAPTGAVAGVDGFVGAGLALGAGICGNSEPDFGEAGLFCAQPRAVERNKEASIKIGE